MNTMKLAIPLFVALAYGPAQGLATPLLSATLASYAVLGASGVTSANVSNIGGNLGSFPTAPDPATSFNFLFGTYQPGNVGTAQTDLTTARATLGIGAGGLTSLNATFIPGTYDFGAGLLGPAETVTLDGLGSNTAKWVFRFTSSLTTVQGSIFSMINVGNGAGVGLYWNVGSTATLDGDTFGGNVLALTSITTNGNLTMSCGRLLADEGNVTLDGVASTISIGCGAAGDTGFGSGGFDQGNANGQAAPEPGTLLLFGFGLAGLFASRKRLLPVV